MSRDVSNLVQRLLDRQVHGHAPGAAVAAVRRFYEHIVPSAMAKQVEPPECQICRFLPSGKLVCVGNMQHDLMLYQYEGFEVCLRHGSLEPLSIPKGLPFNRLFKEMYRRTLAHGHELLCKELCLAAYQEEFLIVASCTAPVLNAPGDEVLVQGVPLVASTTFHLVRAADGELCDQYTIQDDFIHLSHGNGVFVLDDMLCILAVRSQTVHILHMTPSGRLVLSQKLGEWCRDDDELVIAHYLSRLQQWQDEQEQMQAQDDPLELVRNKGAGPGPSSERMSQEESLSQPTQLSLARVEVIMERAVSAPVPQEARLAALLALPAYHRLRTHLPTVFPAQGGGPRPPAAPPGRSGQGILGGLRQRVLTYLFLECCTKQSSLDARKRFFYHFEDFAHLAIWKVQMLDREHLLLSLGPPDAGLARAGEVSAQSYCLLVWSIPEARVVDLHDLSSTALLKTYQRLWHYFHAGCVMSPWHRFLSPSVACRTKITSATSSTVVRRILGNLPVSSQVLCPSPYLDIALWQYDEKLISPMMRPRPFGDPPLRFAARSHPDASRFKLQPSSADPPANSGRPLRQLVSYHFHPCLPVVLCVVQCLVAPPQVSVYFRTP